jgi:hypothetical protein
VAFTDKRSAVTREQLESLQAVTSQVRRMIQGTILPQVYENQSKERMLIDNGRSAMRCFNLREKRDGAGWAFSSNCQNCSLSSPVLRVTSFRVFPTAGIPDPAGYDINRCETHQLLKQMPKNGQLSTESTSVKTTKSQPAPLEN